MRAALTISAIFAAVIFCSVHCKKKADEPSLPPITSTGTMTFGCKVNGKVFVPKDGRGKPGLFVQYLYIDGGWNLNIPATDWIARPTVGVSITTDSLFLQEGMNYQFSTSKGYAQAFYSKEIEFQKLDTDSGQLYISKHDQVNRILSGTFFFVGTHVTTGEKIFITDGRFDIRY